MSWARPVGLGICGQPGKLDPEEHLPSCWKCINYEEHSKVQMAYPELILM